MLKDVSNNNNESNTAECHRCEKEEGHDELLMKSYQKLEEMRDIIASSEMGTWQIYLLDGKAPKMEADDLMLKLLGLTDRTLTPEEIYDAWFSNIDPSALDSVYASLEAMEKGERDENTYIWNHPILGPRYVRCGGVGKPVEGGMVYRGYHYDVDEDIRKRKQKDREFEEQWDIIQTLSMSFRNVFTANLQDGRAKVIRLAEDYQVKAVRDAAKASFSFDDIIRRWTKENVCPEDKERIAKIMNMENLRQVFARQSQLVGTYRSIEGDQLHNYQYDFRRVGTTDTIVAGFRIIDAIVKEQEMRLKEEKEHAEVISSLSTIYSTIFRADLDSHQYEVLTTVKPMEEITGKQGNFDDVKAKVLEVFMAADMRETMDEFLNLKTLADRLKKVNTIETEYKNPQGQWMKARFIVKRRDGEGKVKEVLYVAHDCTDEKIKEFEQKERLSQALASSRQASKAKSTFLSNMSHDIRTPMNAIMGFTALAQSHIDDQELVKDYLDKISTSGAHLLSLINDVLDMSRIASGSVKLEEKLVHLPDLFRDLRAMTQGMVAAKNLNFYVETKDVKHEDVFADKLRLNQVLLNIIGNAIKFTEPGGDIGILISEKPSSKKDSTTYEITVRDSGIGMSKEFMEHIFETFTRENTATVSGIQGTGLGMAITKNIVNMMGGDIQVDSKEGKGSVFTVILNLRLSNADASKKHLSELEKGEVLDSDHDDFTKQKKKSHNYAGKRALLAEDNELNAEIATAILEETGMVIDSVNDGDIAVETIRNAPADYYDLVFMDIQMPKMDGYTATREIRTLADNHKAYIPIVAMTANAFEEDKQKAFACGMNGHIIKPVSMVAIAQVLDEIFEEKEK